ncbi:unnamed protein product [Ceutorhynchus assimilis]|uniref:Uncharacterized protein n=1 Tax=Ceutorhynchus assimilis TaxID=467358 RepID=A0A9N9MXT0_9CUCU|nr:unnamed protein product [Ceutorhynchus assimilis]
MAEKTAPLRAKQSWQDLKKNVKAKNSRINQHTQGTGGGPPTDEEFNHSEMEILGMLVPTILSGIHDIESDATFEEGETEEILIESQLDKTVAVEEDNKDDTVVVGKSKNEAVEPTAEQIRFSERENKENVPSPKANNPRLGPKTPDKKRKFTTTSARLQSSLTMSKELLSTVKENLDATEAYRAKKLKLLENQLVVQEAIRDHLKELKEYFQQNSY